MVANNETGCMIEIVGDVHGKFYDFARMDRGVPIIQIGDMGIGFRGIDNYGETGKQSYPTTMPDNIHFIRGNHDNPQVCEGHPNHLGKFGVKEIAGLRIGFIGGGYSVDHPTNTEYVYQRIPNIDWWEDEELSMVELQAAIDLITDEKDGIDIMVSHEAPSEITKLMMRKKPARTRTALALQALFENLCDTNKLPKLWVFGHFHETRMIHMNGINFHCLGELTKMKVDIVK